MRTTESVEGLEDECASEVALDLDGVYRQHAARVSRWVVRLWGTRDVEDVLHEVFIVVQRRLPEFRGDAAITTWLFAITVRVVSARRRKERWRRRLFARHAPELYVAPADGEAREGSAKQRAAETIVYRVLEAMSERDRTLLILFELEGLSGERIAEVLSISEDNVWVSLHRARIRFRKVVSKRFARELGAADVESR